MLPDGVYKYYKINDNGGRVHEGTVEIVNQQLKITQDPYGLMGVDFENGPVTRKTEDVMRSVNRNQYAVFIKDEHKQTNNPEDVQKGEFSNKIKTGLAGMAIAASAVAPSMANNQKPAMEKPAITQMAPQRPVKSVSRTDQQKNRILGSIMDVESSGGKNVKHARLPQNSMHQGSRAYGKFGLTPVIIRETLKANPKTFANHQKAIALKGSNIHDYMDRHPELEHQIASTHYDRLAKVFGHDPAKIGFAWLQGVSGTKRALNSGVDINKHWHVLKIKKAYEARKKKDLK